MPSAAMSHSRSPVERVLQLSGLGRVRRELAIGECCEEERQRHQRGLSLRWVRGPLPPTGSSGGCA